MLHKLANTQFLKFSSYLSATCGGFAKLPSLPGGPHLFRTMTKMLASGPAPPTSFEQLFRTDRQQDLGSSQKALNIKRMPHEDIRIAASLLQVLQKEEIVAALSSLELLQRLPFGNSLELTVAGALDKAMWTGLDFSTAVACTKVLSPAGLYALCERAELSCLQLSTAMALALLYCLDSFEHCVGGEGALLYTLQHTYLSVWGNITQDRLERWCSQVATHQSEILRRCGYNVWIREELHLGPALTTLTSQPFLQSQLQQVCETIHQHTSVRLAVNPAGSTPLAPVTPPQCTMRPHTDMMKVAYKYILDAQHNHEIRMADVANLAVVSDVSLLKRLYNSPDDTSHQCSFNSDVTASTAETPLYFRPSKHIDSTGCFPYEASNPCGKLSVPPGKENKDPSVPSLESKLRPSKGRMCKSRHTSSQVKCKGRRTERCARRQPSSRIVRLRTMRSLR